MADWVFLLGGGAVLFWGGAWLLVHLGNFETRLSQLRQVTDNRIGGLERNIQAQIRQLNEGQTAVRLATAQIKELQTDVAALRPQLDELKKTILSLELAVSELKAQHPRKNVKVG